MTDIPVPIEPRVHVFIGGYGCGKTELSLNTAFALRAIGHPVALVDLDIVNPYFRSAERCESLEAQGIRVIAPVFALTSVDVPALSAQIQSVFDRTDERVVFDAGGDDAGAAALGRYAALLRRENTGVWYVINARRPMSGDAESNLDRLSRITARSRLQPDGIIHNTNLGDQTSVRDLIDSHAMIERVSRESGIPVVAAIGQRSIAAELPGNIRAIYRMIHRYMRPEFFDEDPAYARS
jgi:hypothetical protein